MSLSRRALLLAAIIITLAIVGLWSGASLAGLWRWPAALLLIAIAVERLRIKTPYTCHRETGHSLPLGQASDYQLTFTNTGKRPLLLESQPDYPTTLRGQQALQRWHLNAGETQTKTLSITPLQLGKTYLGNIYIRILGHYGLVWWNQTIDTPFTIKIEPAPLEHKLTIPSRSGTGSRHTRLKPGSGFELLALRTYRQGDPLRSIDWKATAKRQQPIVRIFEREQHLELAILIDCGRAGFINCKLLDRLHHYVNIASRLAEFAVNHDDRVACIAYADQIINIAPMANGISAVKTIRELLTGLTAVPEEADPLSAVLEVKRLLKRRGLVILLTDVDQAEASAQLVQAVHLLSTKHQVLVASIEDESINELILKPSQHWLAPYQNFAALEYHRGREITRNKLKRQGVTVVSAPPQLIDQRVLQSYQKLRERNDI